MNARLEGKVAIVTGSTMGIGAAVARRFVDEGARARPGGRGSIVNIASVHGHKVIKGCFPYPVAKHGLIGLTRSLGVEYAARGIRVNSISPGLILTERIEAWLAGFPDPEAERRRQAALLPCGWIGEPKDVAAAALFLASDEARFVNASDLLVDGGRSQVYHD